MTAKKPTSKEIVLALMSYEGREKRSIIHKQSKKQVQKTYLKYKCPRSGCSSPLVSFLDKSGFNNPYIHLKRCFAKGQSPADQEHVLLKMYDEAKLSSTTTGGSMLSHLNGKSTFEYERAVFEYIQLITSKSLPLSYVNDPVVRDFSKFSIHVEEETVVQVILKLVELVEKRIAEDMSGTVGAILFDEWTCSSKHYTGVMASFCKSIPMHKHGIKASITEPKLVLLAMSPTGHIEEEGEDTDNTILEVTKFNAQSHIDFFQDIFPHYGQTFNDWCVCLIGNNSNTNLKTAQLANKPYVGCNSHKLNLELNMMVDNQGSLKRTIDVIGKIMVDARTLKNVALLRNLTDLEPIFHNVAPWSGKFDMLQRYNRIRDQLISVQESEDSDFYLDTTQRMFTRTQKYAAMFEEINIIVKLLQEHGRTLSQCKDDLDVLVTAVEEDKTCPNSALYGCNLGKKYISTDSNIVENKDFENGVVKLQKGLPRKLTALEKTAVECLKVKTSGNNSDNDEDSEGTGGITERLRKRQKTKHGREDYIDSRFILGSVAEVERLRSEAQYVLTENHGAITPQLFEAIIFLKVNSSYWDAALVGEALHSLSPKDCHASSAVDEELVDK